MRFGMLAAAAVALVCAGQANAARYFEFQIQGVTTVPFEDPAGGPPKPFLTATQVTAIFDTLNPMSIYISPGIAGAGLSGALSLGTTGRLSTLNQPGGTFFDFAFNPSAIANSLSLQTLNVTGSYGFINCARGFCFPINGTVTSALARTSDTAPAFLGTVQVITSGAVPEPAAWGMMILGFGIVGASLRRRRMKVVFAR